MAWCQLALWLSFVLILVRFHGHQYCYEEERMSLLEFKAHVQSNVYDYVLQSWAEDDPHCCGWDRVKCSNTTAHIIQLSLNNIGKLSSPLNLSIFQSFKQLMVIDLSGNHIGGWINHKAEGSGGLLRLDQLETLDLSGNSLQKSPLWYLTALTSLKHLNLASNRLEGFFPVQDLKPLTRLEILDLGWNYMHINITSNLGELNSLRALSLVSNILHGTLAGLCELKRLEELDLRYGQMGGMLPQCLNNLTSLRYLDLSNNSFKGSFSFNSFANYSNLEAFMLTCDDGKPKIDVDYLSQNPLFQLKILKLSGCNLNGIDFISHQHQLRELDLSHNLLNATFPSWLLENNVELEFLNLHSNSFTGNIVLPSHTMRNIVRIDLSNNHLSGKIPIDIGRIMPDLRSLSLSKNHLEGDIPSSFSAMRELKALDLSFNNFSGEVPNERLASCAKLQALILSQNKFSGKIFSSHFNLSNLSWLDLRDNRFSEHLPNSVKLPWLHVLDISNNCVSGKIPSWVGKAEVLVLRNNSFEGNFPCEQLLDVGHLDVSYNSLSGPLPSCFNPSLRHLNLERNNFTGSIPNALFNLSELLVLNLRDNSLSGSISDSVKVLPKLKVLLFGKNQLTGLIPKQLCRFESISIMDLSNNSFNGPIPPCFSNINFGKLEPTTYSMDNKVYFSIVLSNFIGYEGLLYPPTFFKASFIAGGGVTEFDFVTKNRVDSYKGDILRYMSGLDLSCNNLTGKLPVEQGHLSSLHALNLSHNQLMGHIPNSFSKLAEIESLDLSFNVLSGEIPSELISLHFLEVFNVTHNNLSGRIPFTGGQFWTFEKSSYLENPLLCGKPLEKFCTTDSTGTPDLPVAPSDGNGRKWFEVDSTVFFASFATTYIIFLLGFISVLLIYPLWRRRWFNFIENCIYSSWYILSKAIQKLSTKLIR